MRGAGLLRRRVQPRLPILGRWQPSSPTTIGSSPRPCAPWWKIEFWLADKGRYAVAIDGRGRRSHNRLQPRSPLGRACHRESARRARPRSCSCAAIRSRASACGPLRRAARLQPAQLSQRNRLAPRQRADRQGTGNYLHRPRHRRLRGAGRSDALFPRRRLPELFCGMPRESGNLVRYPVACSPQAWAAGAPFLFCRPCSASTPTHRGPTLNSQSVAATLRVVGLFRRAAHRRIACRRARRRRVDRRSTWISSMCRAPRCAARSARLSRLGSTERCRTTPKAGKQTAHYA